VPFVVRRHTPFGVVVGEIERIAPDAPVAARPVFRVPAQRSE
jgi:hypothetical protein